MKNCVKFILLMLDYSNQLLEILSNQKLVKILEHRVLGTRLWNHYLPLSLQKNFPEVVVTSLEIYIHRVIFKDLMGLNIKDFTSIQK
jgi:hypothetical protein